MKDSQRLMMEPEASWEEIPSDWLDTCAASMKKDVNEVCMLCGKLIWKAASACSSLYVTSVAQEGPCHYGSDQLRLVTEDRAGGLMGWQGAGGRQRVELVGRYQAADDFRCLTLETPWRKNLILRWPGPEASTIPTPDMVGPVPC
ncbi:hypothetical protein EVAR_65279_1 [Eumeta japonica]|uniref:Uncharacterized protein n=1 Tax=Eumeta variegata TaxID=151549 RepID=A0A4C1ZLA6_EUMVA|nr:hypothetical protein EVAR_65279_1 [Eumeta japonica]